MNMLRLSALLLGCFALVALTSVAAAADEKAGNKEKIVGEWIVTKTAGGLPPKAMVHFAKDGKLKISAKLGDKELTIQGTYSVKADKLTIVMKEGEKEHKETMTIKTLTGKKLVTVDAKGKEDEFEKK
ncbi:MAG TPA: lipocalin family protein [Gemmataceae bacterium]|nr:lipocalin family protein [Gemmataceae bacterium]